MSNLYIYVMSFGYTNLPFICSCLFIWSFVTLYLDDFILNNNKYIKIQLFCLILIPLYAIYSTYNIFNFIDVSTYVDKNSNTSVYIGKDAAVEISKGINSVGSQVGLGASIVGVYAAIGKSITKSSIPPVQKAIIIVGGTLIGGFIHSGISHINRANALKTISNNYSKYSSTGNTIVNKLLDDMSSKTNPLEGLLSSIQGINYIYFALVIVLIIQLYIRLHKRKC